MITGNTYVQNPNGMPIDVCMQVYRVNADNNTTCVADLGCNGWSNDTTPGWSATGQDPMVWDDPSQGTFGLPARRGCADGQVGPFTVPFARHHAAGGAPLGGEGGEERLVRVGAAMAAVLDGHEACAELGQHERHDRSNRAEAAGVTVSAPCCPVAVTNAGCTKGLDVEVWRGGWKIPAGSVVAAVRSDGER
ncbi:hypothetical protein [Streptacidiphilus rugosus]|uniref:hypothetical protein n=1 Tax=Streptacidiphilus rugosus TaxID=405783 RepID=UPI0012FBC7F8|nr:hypothetical protein [Streptacidiphilus rugosus]